MLYTTAYMGATQKSCTNFLALKGRNIPAQGSALGKYKKEFLALKGRYINGLHFIIVILCYALSGLKTLKCSDPGAGMLRPFRAQNLEMF